MDREMAWRTLYDAAEVLADDGYARLSRDLYDLADWLMLGPAGADPEDLP